MLSSQQLTCSVDLDVRWKLSGLDGGGWEQALPGRLGMFELAGRGIFEVPMCQQGCSRGEFCFERRYVTGFLSPVNLFVLSRRL